MGGHRGIWKDGWKAVTKHTQNVPYDDDVWELYKVDEDFSECHDLAASEPGKLTELIDLWWAEADTHGVLPLDDRLIELFAPRYHDNSVHPTSRRYVYRPPMAPLPAQVGASLGGKAWRMTATITRDAGENGVLFATGTANSGLSLFLESDRLVLDYNAFGDHTVLASDVPVPVGEATVAVRFKRAGNEGDFTVVIDGEDAGSAHVPLAMRIMSSIGHSIGYDAGSQVSPRYTDPNPFQGTLHRLEVLSDRAESADVEAELAAGMSRQ
jgi:hypothetical protein